MPNVQLQIRQADRRLRGWHYKSKKKLIGTNTFFCYTAKTFFLFGIYSATQKKTNKNRRTKPNNPWKFNKNFELNLCIHMQVREE